MLFLFSCSTLVNCLAIGLLLCCVTCVCVVEMAENVPVIVQSQNSSSEHELPPDFSGDPDE